ncbi:alpha-(1,6)-fucosyltransferase-like [Mercenaria mercenaria]|uniref:alpha-(1,6)-fucosyltransferase-like n=1 Tax=Mercenaria mercenaria TaxID=6596 RepID=UPI00234E9C3A|nr:alpha-(1,6)-fucosyltransferase-like [Mercenaria mercenaria]
MKYWQYVTGLLVLWLLVIIYMSNTVFPNASDSNFNAERQLQRAMEELQKLRDQNIELHALASEIKDLKFGRGGNTDTELTELKNKLDKATVELERLQGKGFSRNGKTLSRSVNVSVPSMEHEMARREVERVSIEFWLYIRSELNKLKQKTTESDIVKNINDILADSFEYQKKLQNDMYKLGNTVDGVGVWREKESRKLGDLVQNRLSYLQNPKNCQTAKKMLCNLGKGCGYGCQLHHVTYCLLMSYATGRTLVLQSEGWRYASKGWETVFQPLSKTCTSTMGQPAVRWGPVSITDSAQVVELPIVDSLSPRPSYLPLAIPDDLADRLFRFHGDPSAWWIGQLVTYLTRPNEMLKTDLTESKKKLGFQNPIVGVHIRRTDKVGMEAQFHGVDEYMKYVDEWFDIYERRNPGVQRRVYLASDDPNVLNEAKNNYPQYIFVSDNEISKTAGLSSRYTDASLRGIILDTHMLSLCDFLVCTFSSQVCRVGYELMQPLHGDASHWFKSLDDIYYFGGQNGHQWQAVASHVPKNSDEIPLNVGDLVGVAGNHWDGYSKGKLARSHKSGLFPSYKAIDKIERIKMPTYPEVPEL